MTFDLDAWVNEATGRPFTFTYGGAEWSWPAVPDLRVTTALTDGDLRKALAVLFGDDFDAWCLNPAVAQHYDVATDTLSPLGDKMLKQLFARHAEHAGSSLGESSASRGSSKSTPKRSRRTSPASTAVR